MYIYDMSKLRGRIAEKGMTLKGVANKLGISANTLSRKMYSQNQFRVDEIDTLCAILEIPFEDIPYYFFAK